MKPAKKSTMDEYLKKHPFLKETAGLHLGLEKILSQLVKPVSFPEKADLIAYTKEGLPLLQQAGLQKRMAEAAAREALKSIREWYEDPNRGFNELPSLIYPTEELS